MSARSVAGFHVRAAARLVSRSHRGPSLRPAVRRHPRSAVRPPAAFLLAAALWALASSACSPRPQAPPAPDAFVEVRPKIGLALGGGGARGFAHVGVLRVLEQEKIPIDVVVGSSVGSLVGALYADKGRVLDAELTALQIEEEDLFDAGPLSILSGGFVRGERLQEFVRKNLAHPAIEDMAVPFAAVAVDLESGQTAVFRRGPAASAVRASCSIPGVFAPAVIDGRTYVDGGVTNPVPVSVARELGAEVVLAVAIPPPARKRPAKNPIAIAYHSVSLMTAEIGRLRAGEADVLIEARGGRVDYDDFSQKRLLIELGEEAARAALPRIRAAIAEHTRRTPAGR